jgi:RNA polymerase sigma-70 factor, ECF subfamily
LNTQSELELIHLAKGGDGTAFAELLRPLYVLAFRLAYGFVHDVDEAEDVVQEAVFTAWRRLGNVREGSQLQPWLLAIVGNQSRAALKRRRWSTVSLDRASGPAASTDLATQVDLHRALAGLGYDDRLVLLLRYYLDLPFEEIAIVLGISTKGARSRVHRALLRLRPRMEVREAIV